MISDVFVRLCSQPSEYFNDCSVERLSCTSLTGNDSFLQELHTLKYKTNGIRLIFLSFLATTRGFNSNYSTFSCSALTSTYAASIFSYLIKDRCQKGEMAFPNRLRYRWTNPHTDSDTLKCLLTFPPLPLLHDGLQPLLLLLRGLGHADEPLVLGRVVDLPAVVYYVPAAVVVGCEAQMRRTAACFDFTGFIKTSCFRGVEQHESAFWARSGSELLCLTGRAINLRSHWSWHCKQSCWEVCSAANQGYHINTATTQVQSFAWGKTEQNNIVIATLELKQEIDKLYHLMN